MTCSRPPSLNDDDLFAALDGDVSPEVLAHLAACAGCSARLTQFRQFENRLHQSLARWDCPSSAELGDYVFDRVPLPRQRAIIQHLAGCVRCTAELEDLQGFLGPEQPQVLAGQSPEPSASPQRPTRIRTLLARLLPQDGARQGMGVRGSADAPLIAQCAAATLVLETLPADRDMLRLAGQIADEAGEQERWNGAIVEIRQGSTIIATAFVDDLGSFSCGPITAGVSEFRVTASEGISILVENLAL